MWVLTYIPGTSLCNMPGVFSHYNYTVYILSLSLSKNRTIQWLNFSCSYEMRVPSVFFQYSRIENPVVLQKWLYPQFFHCNPRLWSVRGCEPTIQETVLPPDATFFLMICVWALLFHPLVTKWVHGCHHVVYFSDDVISKISSSSYQQLDMDTKTSCFYHTAVLNFLSTSLVKPHFLWGLDYHLGSLSVRRMESSNYSGDKWWPTYRVIQHILIVSLTGRRDLKGSRDVFATLHLRRRSECTYVSMTHILIYTVQ